MDRAVAAAATSMLKYGAAAALSITSPDGAADPPFPLDLKRSDARFTMTRCFYRGFASKLHHKVPHWVESGALFHIRIAIDREKEQSPLTAAPLAKALLDSARLYEVKQRWHITLFLLMPDHLHALLSFAKDQWMSRIVGDWKHFQTRKHGIIWQEGYFDHRLRADERGDQLSAKMDYIRQNPVAANLCVKADDWPWIIERAKGGSSSPLLDAKIWRRSRIN